MKRIILSRKGFDSKAGRKASPIFKDNKIFSLPIPQKVESPTKYGDLHSNGIKGIEALREASVKTVNENDFCHYDPALNEEIGIFGQQGPAQGHLRNNEVDIGDLFLFFGWFKQYSSRGQKKLLHRDGVHHIFGWLQISEIVSENENIKEYLESKNIEHPHGYGDVSRYKLNTLYISTQDLKIGNQTTNLKGHGVFKYSTDDLILTSPEHSSKSMWKLPKEYFKGFSSPPKYPDKFFNRSFATDKRNFLVNTDSGPWQEAVLDSENNPKVKDWALKLISEHG